MVNCTYPIYMFMHMYKAHVSRFRGWHFWNSQTCLFNLFTRLIFNPQIPALQTWTNVNHNSIYHAPQLHLCAIFPCQLEAEQHIVIVLHYLSWSLWVSESPQNYEHALIETYLLHIYIYSDTHINGTTGNKWLFARDLNSI